MSHIPFPTPSTPSANFQAIFDAALDNYKKKTKRDLLTDRLTAQLDAYDSPSAILDLLNITQRSIQSQSGSGSTKQWLNATVHVLCGFSAALGEGVGLVLSPEKVIFSGIGVFLITAKEVGASQDALIALFERIESFFERLKTYVAVRPTEAMKNLIIKIMVEILGILAIATKEIKQRWAKKYMKKLVGRTDIEDALKMLEKLSNDEALTATVQILQVTDRVDNRMGEVVDGVREARVATQQIAINFIELKRDRLRQKFREWLSPPDPSINYNTARDAYHDGTAGWFTRSGTFEHWKAAGSESVLWIQGEPGSGKSILSSTIIHDLQDICHAGPSSVAYFFFDFKDAAKQDARALLSSFLVQLCARSDPASRILFDAYSTHDNGSNQPSEGTLLQCLKNIFTVLGQAPIYLIIDALDESPNTSKVPGVPPSRQKVLEVVKELADLSIPNLHVCATSRPEYDIRVVLGQLSRFKVSLHDEDGQKQDIANYVHSVIHSDKDPVIKKWGRDVKDLVVKTLSERANVFRWVVCQLDTLRRCLGRNVENALCELPKSLDETYQRVLREINEANQKDVYRLLQCLVVSVRPLRIEELAEVLAVDFDGADGIPRLNPDWRWEDQEEALQAACSSLIAVIDTGDARVVQFSHFSVKEFLTSPRLSRLAGSSGDVSRYYISMEPAHTILAQSCLGVLLRLPVDDRADDDSIDDTILDGFPLAGYAAEHWVDHAQFESVSSHVCKAMEHLFNPDKPHFLTWLRLHDIDTEPLYDSVLYAFAPDTPERSNMSPLYYAALCGLHGLAEHLVLKHLQDVNIRGGYYVTPLVAALAGKYFHVAELLYQHGGTVDPRGHWDATPLHAASYAGDLEIMQWLLGHGADANVLNKGEANALHHAAGEGQLDAARMLLQTNVDPKPQDEDGWTPLHHASNDGHTNVARLLLAHGVDVNARDKGGSTPLHLASRKVTWSVPDSEAKLAVACALLEHGADIGAKDDKDRTAFQDAEETRFDEMMKFLSEHMAPQTESAL